MQGATAHALPQYPAAVNALASPPEASSTASAACNPTDHDNFLVVALCHAADTNNETPRGKARKSRSAVHGMKTETDCSASKNRSSMHRTIVWITAGEVGWSDLPRPSSEQVLDRHVNVGYYSASPTQGMPKMQPVGTQKTLQAIMRAASSSGYASCYDLSCRVHGRQKPQYSWRRHSFFESCN